MRNQEMEMEINFDMDGTLADFYSVPGWLECLENEDTRPYAEARPLVNFSALAKQIHRLQAQGYTVNIITWCSKGATKNFDMAVAIAKQNWLDKHLPSVKFDNIYIVKYGTPKSHFGNGILFDDEARNREEWKGIAYDEKDILATLRALA